jgi:hypothetical protein
VKTNIAGHRDHGRPGIRSATLNVRAEPKQYRSWKAAADRSGKSLSAWAAYWLDQLATGYGRVLALIERHGPSFGGLVPISWVLAVAEERWAWSPRDVAYAIEQLVAEDLLVLHGPSNASERRPGLFIHHGRPVESVALAFRLKRRPRHIP